MRYWKHAVGIIISTACLIVVFREVAFDQALQILNRVRYLPLLCSLIINILSFWVRAWRWKYFFRKEHKPTVAALTIANLIGFLGNTIFPLRIGEVMRAVTCKRKIDAPIGYILATLFVERLFDMLCVMLCLIIPITLSTEIFKLPNKTGWLFTSFFILILLLFLIIRIKPEFVMNLSLPLARKVFSRRFFERFQNLLAKFTEGLMILREWGSLFKITLLSLFLWWLSVFSYYLAFSAFSLSFLPWSAPYFTLGFVCIGMILPSAPAYIGTFHAAYIFSLTHFYGVDKNTAASLAVIFHLLISLILVIAGLVAIWYEGLKLGQISQKTKIDV